MMVKSKAKYIQSLSQKKLRDEDNVFVAEGPKIINELLSAENIEVLELFAVPEWVETHQFHNSSKITVVDPAELRKISFQTTPNQVIGLFRKPLQPGLHLGDSITIMADNIQDPGNLGTIVRCADWFGIGQVVCSRDCADVFAPKTVQATMGSIARVTVFYEDLEEVIKAHPSTHVYAATLAGENVHDMKPIRHGSLLIGNESKGINMRLLTLAHQQITIPRTGKAESLNAAVATGIILSHLVKAVSPSHSRS